MTRDDWLFVGVRLFGVYVFVSAATEVPTGMHLMIVGQFGFLPFVGLALRIAVGAVLACWTADVLRLLDSVKQPKKSQT